MSLLRDFFKKDFFNKKEERALGVDIGSSAIKVVQLAKRGAQAVLETYGELALGPYGGAVIGQSVQLPPDKIAQALIDLMKEKEVNITTKRAGLSIPFSSSLMSVVEMPRVSSKQLETMVPFEARKYIPVPINEVLLDWSVVPKASGSPQLASRPEEADVTSKIDVLVVAIHKDTVARYQEIVAKAGLQAGFFEIELFSTMRAVLEETLRPVLIMDMGAASTKLYIVERGVVRGSHTVNRGSQDITAALAASLSISPEKAEMLKRDKGLLGEGEAGQSSAEIMRLTLDYIFTEANNTLLAFEKKYNKTVSKAILIGGGASLKGIIDYAKNNLKTEVTLGLPFNKVSAPAFLDQILRETGPEFAVAVGLALRRLAGE